MFSSILKALFGACSGSSTGGHYFTNQGGTWVCSLCGESR